MTRRLGPAILVSCALLALLSGCGGGDGPYRNLLFQAQRVNGQTYIVLLQRPALPERGDRGLFRIYRSGGPDGLSWQPLDENRMGPVFGTFAIKEATGERLGLFHEQRISLWKLGEDAVEVETKNLPFKWIAETGAQLEDTLYLFGGKMERRAEDGSATWRLAAACYDGSEFRELDPGPIFKPGPQGMFSLQAVAHRGRIHLFWRSAREAGPLDFEPPVTFVGPLRMAVFDGLAFGQEVQQFADLPLGHVDVWSDGTDLRAVVQPQEAGTARTPPLRIFTLGLAGTVREEIHEPFEAPLGLHFKYFDVTRLPGEGRSIFLRSNSQDFEVWESAGGAWRVQPATGLPQQQLMSLLLMALGLCVGLIAMGVGMAIRRRRQMQWVLQRLRPQDVLAPLSMRISAYLIDVSLVVVLTYAICVATDTPVPSWSMVFVNFQIVPAFGLLYLSYFVFAEWRLGRTPGKWLLGIQVVTDQGDPPTLWSAFVRNLIGFFERLMVLPAIVAIVLTPRGQRIGDLLSRTLVVQRAAFLRYREERQRAQAGKADAALFPPKASSPEPPDAPRDGDGTS